MLSPAFSLNLTSTALDPRVTFTRSGDTATVINSSGYVTPISANLPRFDYNPVTLACKGLLIEEARTNLTTDSQGFSTGWSFVFASVSNGGVTYPDGTTTGKKLIGSNGSTYTGAYALNAIVKAASAITYTATIYAKAAEYNQCQILLLGNTTANFAYARFNLADGSLFASGIAGAFAIVGVPSATPVGNGWFRLTLTATSNSDTSLGFRVYSANSTGTTNNGTSGIYVWGAQVEVGAFATSYIPTTTTALTRNADVATITGTDFSDWWQAGLGGATVQALPSTVSGIRPLIQFDDGTSNEIIALRGNTTNPELYVVDGGTPQSQIDAGTIAANTAYSLTGWWQINFCAARKDNGARVEDLTATIPTVTQARIGSDGTNYLNGHLATINYYDQFSGQIYTRRKNKAVFTVI